MNPKSKSEILKHYGEDIESRLVTQYKYLGLNLTMTKIATLNAVKGQFESRITRNANAWLLEDGTLGELAYMYYISSVFRFYYQPLLMAGYISEEEVLDRS